MRDKSFPAIHSSLQYLNNWAEKYTISYPEEGDKEKIMFLSFPCPHLRFVSGKINDSLFFLMKKRGVKANTNLKEVVWLSRSPGIYWKELAPSFTNIKEERRNQMLKAIGFLILMAITYWFVSNIPGLEGLPAGIFAICFSLAILFTLRYTERFDAKKYRREA